MGKKTRIDIERGLLRGVNPFGVDGTWEVREDEFAVGWSPCVVLKRDYTNGVEFNDGSTDGKQPNVTIDVIKATPTTDPSTGLPSIDSTAIQKLVVHVPSIGVCHPNVLTNTADGKPNKINIKPTKPSAQRDEDLNSTFEHIVTDMAESLVPASSCVEDLVNMQAAQDEIKAWVVGQIATKYPQYNGIPLEMDAQSPAVAREAAQGAFQAKVQGYRELKKAIFGKNKDKDFGIKIEGDLQVRCDPNQKLKIRENK